VAKTATDGGTVRQEEGFLPASLGMGLDLSRANVAGSQLFFHHLQGGLFHPGAIDRDSIQEVLRRRLANVCLDALQIEKHGSPLGNHPVVILPESSIFGNRSFLRRACV
jgi:hypothetical protein